MPGLSALFALLLLCCCLGGAYLLALELGIRHGGWARACATLALAYGLLIAAFELLLGLGVFTLGAALLLWVPFTGLLLVRGWARAGWPFAGTCGGSGRWAARCGASRCWGRWLWGRCSSAPGSCAGSPPHRSPGIRSPITW
ncbi:hypothetical protein ACN28S_52580 [Cystobacter fuscus]